MEEIKQQKKHDVDRFMEDMESKMGQVFYILKEFPETRDNDGLLLVKWLQRFRGVQSFDSLTALAQSNELNSESIRRARQKIQAAGHFLASDETVLKRRRRQDFWRALLSTSKP